MFIRDLSVRKKMLAGFGLTLSITFGVVWASLSALDTTLQRFEDLLEVNAINVGLKEAQLFEKEFVMKGDAKSLEKALALVDEVHARAARCEGRLLLPDNKALMRKVQGEVASYRDKLVGLGRAITANSAAQGAMDDASRKAFEEFDRLDELLGNAAASRVAMSGDPMVMRLFEDSSQANEMAMELHEARRSSTNYITQRSPADAEQVQEFFSMLEFKGAQLSAGLEDPQARASVEHALGQLADYSQQFNALRKSLDELESTRQAMVERAQQVVASSEASSSLELQSLQNEAAEARALIIGAAVVALLVGLAGALMVTQSIVGPLQRLVGIARKVAAGDLTEDLHGERSDELGLLMHAVQEMTLSLRQLIGQLGGGIAQIANAAQGLSGVTRTTSQGAKSQRLEIEQAVRAMAEMVVSVQHVARNADGAAESARHADEQTRAGGLTVQQAIVRTEQLALAVEQSAASIGRLKDESANIGTVLDVIKGIAEQTNLLALNAAIEAARAGEGGRGFAVVAEEVRALARRTQQSTAQIQQLIHTLQEGAQQAVAQMEESRVMAGDTVQAARQAGLSLVAIDQSVSHIQQLNHQIAITAEQQSAVAQQVNQSVASIRDVAEQSAAASEEVSAASADLAQLGGEMKLLVGRFDLSDEARVIEAINPR
ncbi:methyl-accepting chemotaxis protein [Pseudomonas sp. NMI795_08]|nr:methyl-accepting chemotaxis protein [Pseudomonas parasichuanensis]MCE1116809.1 methyl-accepting chemotaxis protein [Pseudomonas sp. NMI795_08]